MKVNYIVANYIGENRQCELFKKIYKTDPLVYYKKHLEFFENTNLLHYVTPTFVFNDDIDDALKEEILSLAKKEYVIIFRKNEGFSYGIWNDVIEKTLFDYDYFFLIEDDYIPAREDFILKHIEKVKDNVAVVCGMVSDSRTQSFYYGSFKGKLIFPHISISNCLITAESCRFVKEKVGFIFELNRKNDYETGYNNQMFFIVHLHLFKFKIVDILDEFSSPFYDSVDKKVVLYGSDKPPLIEPIILAT